MDFISLSPSDDDIFDGSPRTQSQGPQLSEEAAMSPVLSVPETAPSLLLHQPRRQLVPAGSMSSVVSIPPGSSLLNLRDYSSSDDSSTSLGTSPPPAKRGRGMSTCHHAPPSSPTSQLPSKISDWTVATLHKVLRERGIHFHRTDNKAKLFDSLMAACCSCSCSNTGVLPGDVTTHATARRDIGTPPREVMYSQVKSSTTQTACRRRKSAPTESAGEREPDTGLPGIPVVSSHPAYLLASVAAAGIGLPVHPAPYPIQPQQASTAASCGTGKPVTLADPCIHPQYLLSHGAYGTGMPAPPALFSSQQLQAASAGADGTGMPASHADLIHRQQLPSTTVTGTGMPASHADLIHRQQLPSTTGTGNGAATSASCNGVPEHFIQIMGRWASLTYHRYIRSDLNDLRSAQARLK
ncbi:serine/arginine repetitive matrix protein 1-like [Scomber scombrus]|uniref:Serine/arginine repetitive matrix protein 1-like n=1 Tax=Scomber scombrus TaxID=13677 RepID=A0AAV1P657_SCOSC